MKIISAVNQKGGTGKNTTVINLAAYLSLIGRRVLIIDFDPQANASSGLGIRNLKPGIYEALSGRSSYKDVIRKVKENLFVIPSNSDLAGAGIEMVNLEQREKILKNFILNIPQDFDFVFIDTPPSLGLLTINSLVASSLVLIPVQAEYYALEGLSGLLNTIKLVQDNFSSDISILGAVLTMYDERSRLPQEVLENLYKNFPYRIFKTVIPRNIRLAEAPSFGLCIFDYNSFCRGAKAYRRLGEEFIFYLEVENK